MKKLIFIITVVMIILVSCSSIDEPILMSRPIQSESKYLSSQEACEIATRAFKDFQMEPISRSSRTAFASLYRSSQSRSGENDTTFYVVNFIEGGFAVVAAERNIPNPIVAISDKGLFSEEGNEPLKEYMNYLSVVFPPIWRDTIHKFEDSILIKIDTIVTYQDRFLPTLWGQWQPYNFYCPDVNNGNKAPAGCAAVAMGQICAYHRRPSSINGYILNWEAMLQAKTIYLLPDDSIGQECITHLLRECGRLLNTEYGITGSGTDYPGNFIEVYNSLGYKNAKIYNDLNQCISSLVDDGPVQITGYKTIDGKRTGHTWVVDGSKILTLKDNYSNKRKEYYLHMNWGAEGGGNGYFLIQIQSGSFNQIKSIDVYSEFSYITNIN